MKQSIVYFLIISLVFAFLNAQAQTVTDVVAFADKQYETGHFDIAAKEYNRALFFGYQPMDHPALRIAQCYFEMGNIDLSAEFYEKAYLYSSSDSIQNEAVLGKSLCLIMKNQPMLALAELFNFNETENSDHNCEYHFLSGTAFFHLKTDSMALFHYQQAMQWLPRNSEANTVLSNTFHEVSKLNRRYSPERSYYLSILPGLGQMSIGEWKEGANSLVLVGLLFYISARIAIMFTYGDAVITAIPWLQRYYMGGMEKSKELAVKKIERKRHQAYEQVIDISTPKRFQ